MKKILIIFSILIALFSTYVIVGFAASPHHPNWASEPTAASLIVGVPDEDAGSDADAGVIDLIYGDYYNGLITTTSEFFGQTSTSGQSEAGDEYGYAVTSGDFNNDGYFDIAIGEPYESDGTYAHSGGVNILYGSSTGFTRQDYFFASDISEYSIGDEDHFGWALAAGDFDNDGFTDLAIGAPNNDCCGYQNSGAVYVLYGSINGLAKVSATFDNLSGNNSVNGHYGWALASADFDGDGYDDLAIGAPGEESLYASGVNGGNIQVGYGVDRDAPIVPGGVMSQSSMSSGVSEDGDQFGWSLATGDFNADGYADVAVGVPGEDIDTTADAGAVNVFYGNGATFSLKKQLWYQDNIHEVGGSSAVDPSEADDEFGYSLAVGDFDSNGYDDLAIGVPFEDHSTLEPDSGFVQVLFGFYSTGLNGDNKNAAIWTYNGLGNQKAGYSLAAGDFDGDKCDDLAIGQPIFSSLGHTNDGGVYVIYGDSTSGNGFWSSYYQEITQDDLPLVAAEIDDHFGHTLAILPPPMHRVYLPFVARH